MNTKITKAVSNATILVVRSRHDGMSTEVTSAQTFEFGNASARNLIKAARFTQGTTGHEGYGAPYYTYSVSVAGVEVLSTMAFNALEEAIEHPSELKVGSGPRTLTGRAQNVLDEVASGEIS